MKIRSDFVTNSSSSSFVCEICGSSESGWDMSLSEAEMYQCENGHTFCQYHAKEFTREEMIELIFKLKLNEEAIYNYETKEYETVDKEFFDDKEDEYLFEFLTKDGYGLPASMCPICSMEKAAHHDLLKYLLKKNNLKAEDILKEWKETFNSYRELDMYLKD